MINGPIPMLMQQGFTVDVAIRFFSVLAIIFILFPFHETAHAWSAKLLGDETAERQGRLTLNPFAHIDPIGALCMFFMPFGWAKPVPVDPRNATRKVTMRGFMSLTAAAGPVSNIILSLLFVIIAKIIYLIIAPAEAIVTISDGRYAVLADFDLMNRFWIFTMIEQFEHMSLVYLGYACMMIATMSVYLAVFNLIPIPPLDGSKILYFFLNNKQVYFIERNMHIIRIVLLLLIFSGFAVRIIGPIGGFIMKGLDIATFFITL